MAEQSAVNRWVIGSSPIGGVREIGAVVAQLLYTQTVVGSNPTFPIVFLYIMKDKKIKKLIQKPLRFHHQDIHEELDEIKELAKAKEKYQKMHEKLSGNGKKPVEK